MTLAENERTIVAMVFGYAIVFTGVTLVAEGWRTIHRARREERREYQRRVPMFIPHLKCEHRREA